VFRSVTLDLQEIAPMAPLPPLPANNTLRLFVIQEGSAGRHETVMRFGGTVTLTDAITRARAICTAVAPLLSTGVSFTQARYQERGLWYPFLRHGEQQSLVALQAP
jgi:hypothetical protein